MQKATDAQKQLPPKHSGEEYPFRPSINECVTAEMFKLKQRKFQEKLQQKKQQTATTKPHSPKFTPVKQRVVGRDYLNESSPVAKPVFKRPVSATVTPSKQPASTRATQLA